MCNMQRRWNIDSGRTFQLIDLRLIGDVESVIVWLYLRSSCWIGVIKHSWRSCVTEMKISIDTDNSYKATFTQSLFLQISTSTNLQKMLVSDYIIKKSLKLRAKVHPPIDPHRNPVTSNIVLFCINQRYYLAYQWIYVTTSLTKSS